jgi:adenosylcobyric acid synthase
LIDLEVDFTDAKTLTRPAGTALGHPVAGYEIHHGRVTRQPREHLIEYVDGSPEGVRTERVMGTHWHGLLDNDGFRRTFLRWAAERAGRDGFTPAPDVDVARTRAAQLDALADLVSEHLDTAALEKLIVDGPTPRPRLRTIAK